MNDTTLFAKHDIEEALSTILLIHEVILDWAEAEDDDLYDRVLDSMEKARQPKVLVDQILTLLK